MTFSVSSVNIQAKTPHKIFPEKVAGCTLEFYLLCFIYFIIILHLTWEVWIYKVFMLIMSATAEIVTDIFFFTHKKNTSTCVCVQVISMIIDFICVIKAAITMGHSFIQCKKHGIRTARIVYVSWTELKCLSHFFKQFSFILD